jgi:hypothetical protein
VYDTKLLNCINNLTVCFSQPSSGVISDLYKKASNDQKQAMRQNFYGNSFKIFKTKEVNTLKEISQMPNTEKEGIFNEINDNLIKVITK